MPFGLNLSIVVIFWFITSWFCADKSYLLSGLKNKWFIILLSFFAMYVISALLSDNKKGALSAIEVKVSFLAFPYFFFLYKIETITIKKMLAHL